MTGSALKILHVFDHSLPLMSGYSMRSLALLEAQHRLGWKTVHLTTPRHDWPGPTYEEVEGFAFHRTAPVAKSLEHLPGLRDIALMRLTARRIRHIASYEKPDLIHTHSPARDAIAAAWAGRKLGIPIVYDVCADREGAPRYRAPRLLDRHAFRKADAIIAVSEVQRTDIITRGIAAEKISVVEHAQNGNRSAQSYCAPYSRALGRPIIAAPTTTPCSKAA